MLSFMMKTVVLIVGEVKHVMPSKAMMTERWTNTLPLKLMCHI